MVLALLAAFSLAAPAFAHVPMRELAPSVDLLHAPAIAEAPGQPFRIVPRDLFAGVAHVEAPATSLSTRLAESFDAQNREAERPQTLHLTRAVRRNLTSGLRESLRVAIIKEINDLGPETRWATGIARARWYDPKTGSWLTPDPLGYGDSPNLYAFAGGDPVNKRDPSGEQYDPAAVHRWFQEGVRIARNYYSSSNSVVVDAAGNTLSDIGSGLSSAFNIGTKTGQTYADEDGFRDAYSTGMIFSAGAGDAGETILAAVGAVSVGVKGVQTVQQVNTLVRIERELKLATAAEQQGELLVQRSLVRRGFDVGPSVKIKGACGTGRCNQGVDMIAERANVVSPNRTLAVEVKSVHRPELRIDKQAIQQGSDMFNETRLARAADPARSSAQTIEAARSLQKVQDAGRLESYKATYDRSKGTVSFWRLASDAELGKTVIDQIKTWLLFP